jgi:hypothetical protein
MFEKFGLDVYDSEEIATHGGSLRIFIKHQEDNTKLKSKRLFEILEKELDFGLLRKETYSKFKEAVESTKRKLLNYLIRERDNGKFIIGYGAPAKGNTLLNYCGIRNDFLKYTVDKNPFKQNKYLPGTHIPVFEPEKIIKDKPDIIMILPWNIKFEIIEQLSYTREWGCKFLIPIPEVSIF